MGELIDRIKGDVNAAVGKAKQAMVHGDSADGAEADAQTEDETLVEELKGKARRFIDKARSALGDDI